MGSGGFRRWGSAAACVLGLLAALSVGWTTGQSHADSIEVTASITTSRGTPLTGVSTYAFTSSGTYTGKSAVTDSGGVAHFPAAVFSAGSYKFRADTLGNQFWSGLVDLPGAAGVSLTVPVETAVVTVLQGGLPKSGIKLYLFNPSGSYLGASATTGNGGAASFDLPAGREFKFRADNLGTQYWSASTVILSGGPNAVSVDTGGGRLTVTVDQGNGPLTGASCYLFSPAGSYLGLSGKTDAAGQVAFDVPTAGYKLRCDTLGYSFWSDVAAVTGDRSLPFSVLHRDVAFSVKGILGASAEPRAGIPCYLFTEAGGYTGQSRTTDASGTAVYRMPSRSYKVRADFLSFQYWSLPTSEEARDIAIPEATAEVTVTRGEVPAPHAPVYVFNAAGSYLGLVKSTDSNGAASFRLPAKELTFRADVLGNPYFQTAILVADQANPIAVHTGGGPFALSVDVGEGLSLAGVTTYLFSDAGSYLGVSHTTDAAGQAVFQLSNGTYKFRVDYLGHSFWTPVSTVPTSQALSFRISQVETRVRVLQGGSPDAGVTVYLFSGNGSYLGVSTVTDDQGVAAFTLPVGVEYRFRADTLGSQYFGATVAIDGAGPNNLAVDTGGGNLTVTVDDGQDAPLGGKPVYLFSPSGSYLGRSATTDAEGRATFAVSAASYQVRCDYLGYSFWSPIASVTADTALALPISHRNTTVAVRLDRMGQSVAAENVSAYLFTEAEGYVGVSGKTDAGGQTVFRVPQTSYKIRADLLGGQFWSDPFVWADPTFTIPEGRAAVTVTKGGVPLANVHTYAFTAAGSYLGLTATTDAQGKAAFWLPAGQYKIRADAEGKQVFSDVTVTAGQDAPAPILVPGPAIIGIMPQLSAGSDHVMVLRSDGTLWAWGYNGDGELGDGTTTHRSIPTRVNADADWREVSAGAAHSAGLKADGSLWAWGDNWAGQVGDGTTEAKSVPTRIGNATDWKALSAGGAHTVAVKADGSLWAWGYNEDGEFGDGTTVSKSVPTRVGTDTGWEAVSAGDSHTVALKADGTLWAWGWNGEGELGDGTTGSRNVPTRIGAHANWATVAAGGSHTVAVRTDGSLWAWGWNYYGQLGDGTTVDKNRPTRVGTDTDWKSVAAGGLHTVALKADGGLWTWGYNGSGQLGDGTTIDRSVPAPVGTDKRWVAVSAGSGFTVALRNDGSVWTSGQNLYGALGNGTTEDAQQLGAVSGLNAALVDGAPTVPLNLAAQRSTNPQEVVLTWTGSVNTEGIEGYRVYRDGVLVGTSTGPTFTDAVPDAASSYSYQVLAFDAGGNESTQSRSWSKPSDWAAPAMPTGLTGSAGADPEQVVLRWTASADNVGVVGYIVYRNGWEIGGSREASFADTIPGPDVSYEYRVSAYDAAGNESALSNRWIWDEAGVPSAPSRLRGRPRANPQELTLVWVASTDNVGVEVYRIYRDGQPIGTAEGTTFVDAILDPSATHVYWVVAYDASGNESLPSNTWTKPDRPDAWTSPQIAAGWFHAIAVRSDGNLWAWGQNANGELGDGTLQFSSAPKLIDDNGNWSVVAAGWDYSVAIKDDGSLWTWGSQPSGGAVTESAVPIRIGSGHDWKLVAAGDHAALGIKDEGSLWAWGGYTSQMDPTRVGADTDWSLVASGTDHSVAVKTGGTLWAWGENDHGQLGDGTLQAQSEPVRIGADSDWRVVAAGEQFTLAIKVDGSLWAWGRNNSGQLGDGTSDDRSTPIRVGTDSVWKAVSAGYAHTMAIRTDSTLWVWGGNSTGQLGAGGSSNVLAPTQIGTGSRWLAAAAGHGFSVALRSDGSLWSSGDNLYGQLGNGSAGVRTAPGSVSGGAWTAAAAGRSTTTAIGVDGSLWEWGTTWGRTMSEPSPLGADTNWKAVAPGRAIKTDGSLWAWGANYNGQLGDGTSTGQPTPIRIGTDSDWQAVAAGEAHTVALKYDGGLWAWGDNTYGELGIGTTSGSSLPLRIGEEDTWKAAAAGEFHTVALRGDGTLWGWGSQPFNGAEADTNAPTRIGADADWIALAAGSRHTLALKADGSLWTWGSYLGSDGWSYTNVPVRVGADSDWAAVSAGFWHSAALKVDGTLWMWGQNFYGQLGDGTLLDHGIPARVGIDTDWTAVSSGMGHSVALKADGSLWTWGWGVAGQLGDGQLGSSTTLVRVVHLGMFEDAVAPTVPVGLVGHGEAGRQVRLEWIVATDNLGVAGYYVYRDGRRIATCDGTVFIDTVPAAGVHYAYRVSAFDANENESEWSAPWTSLSDWMPPSVPTGLMAQLGPASAQVILTWQASSDDVGISGYTVYADGNEIGTSDRTTFSDMIPAGVASRVYEVSAFDSSGNRSGKSQPIEGKAFLDSDGDGLDDNWELSNFGTLLLGANDDPDGDGIPNLQAFLSGVDTRDRQSPTVPQEVMASPTLNGLVYLSWQASTDNVVVARYNVYVSGRKVGAVSSTSYLALGEGGCSEFQVSAYDALGNESAKSEAVWAAGGPAAPSVSITSPTAGLTVNSAWITVTGSGVHAGEWVTVNGQRAVVKNGQFYADVVPLNEGENAITVTAGNRLGQTSVATRSVYRAGGTAPVTLTASLASGVAPLTVQFNTDVSLANPVVKYRWDLDGDGAFETESSTLGPKSMTYTSSRFYAARVRVTDAAGVVYTDAARVRVYLPAEILREVSAQTPLGLATDKAGSLYVAEQTGGRVSKYDATGALQAQIGGGELASPTSVTVDDAGTIYVTDVGTTSVHTFDEMGNPLGAFGGDVLRSPRAVFATGSQILVADAGAKRVFRFATDGELLGTIGDAEGPGMLESPTGVTVGAAGEIVVSDGVEHRIVRFSVSGEYVGAFGGAGSGDVQFLNPIGVFWDSRNAVLLVVDQGNNRVVLLDSYGVKAEVSGSRLGFTVSGGAVTGFDPLKQVVYVSDTGNRVLQVGIPAPAPPEVWNLMVARLASGRTDDALTYFDDSTREKYRELFCYVGGSLPAVMAALPPITPKYIHPTTAAYEADATVTVNGTTAAVPLSVQFVRDEDEVWHIRDF